MFLQLGQKYSLAYLRALFVVHYLMYVIICDLSMFLLRNRIASYTNDNTTYSIGDSIHYVIIDLEQTSNILSKSFTDNYLKANPDNLLSKNSNT